MTLTLILPVHGRQAELRRALASLSGQMPGQLKIIVVDDASEPPIRIDESATAGLDVTLLRRAKNGGAAAARNTGMHASSTDWVTFLDSDDALLPGTLAARWQAVLADQAKGADPKRIYGCSWLDCLPDGTALQLRHPRASRGPADFAGGCWFSPGSCIILNRIEALKAAGDQDETLRRLEDFDWFLTLGLAGFQFWPQRIVGAKIERSRTVSPTVVDRTASTLERKWRAAAIPVAYQRRVLAYLCLERSSAAHFAGQKASAAYWLLRSFLYRPRLSLQLTPAWELEPPGSFAPA